MFHTTIQIILAITAIFSIIMAFWQSKGKTISAARIQWIEDLRECISQYVAAVFSVVLILKEREELPLKKVPNDKIQYDKESKELQTNLKSKSEETVYLFSKAKLYLNDKDLQHVTVLTFLNKLNNLIGESKLPQKEIVKNLDKDVANLFEVTQMLFKSEWEKSKKFICYSEKNPICKFGKKLKSICGPV